MNYQKTTGLGGNLDQALAKSLPLLPGYSFNLNVGADRFHRPAHWGITKGINVLNDRDDPRPKPGIGGRDPPPWAPCRTGPDHSVYPRGHGSNVPSWIAFNKQVLVFEAYYQEPIPESAMESYRIHRCKIYFFLEDDTAQVIEPKVLNSGIPQGQIIRRHRIPLPSPCEDQFYTLEHFNVGCEVNLYGKIFYICGCDGFTRSFLNRLGISVPQNMDPPTDPAGEKIKDKRSSLFPRKPHHTVDKRGPFLQHAGHVLRFWAYWDDRCKLYGDLRYFVIHYFLSDNTMEVREILRPNSGYEAYPLFARRGKVPKNCDKLIQLPGMDTPMTVLNVFGSIYASKNKKAHYMVDNLADQDSGIEFFKDSDLAIGAVLNIFGRAFILTDCDEFTRQYYRDKYNVQDFTPLTLNEPKRTYPKPVPPPYNGWGTEEDSLQSWKSVELKPLNKDYRKYAEKERDILRFEAKFYKALQKVNQSRRFIIQYFMSDDTIMISEKEHLNSGLPKGKFLLRSQAKKPGHQIEIGEEASFWEYKDLFVGNILDINGFQFQLINADEFTLCYMEANKHMFPHANVCLCLDKLREAMGPLQAEDVVKCFSENDTCLQGVLDIRNFRTLIMQIAKCGMSEHEILTLARAVSYHKLKIQT
ncbi:EF-hand domain-containing family member C2 [Orchesella cincta]|uniref:EF-hand domain-containing family member C2 n=1 Tax=Orchesella cincta TaxID=48709 RepID=A0A1D2MVF8_ORCCI|nr:EF-hand domain-containing family member C2 [Orchesella cincta]